MERIEGHMRSFAEGQADLRSQVSSMSVALLELGNDMKIVKPAVQSLIKGMAKLTTDVTGLKRDVSGLKKDVSGLKRDITGLKKNVTEINTGLTRVEKKLDNHGERLAFVEAEFSP